jgi:tetratricopeptide (TPR) repeat protein
MTRSILVASLAVLGSVSVLSAWPQSSPTPQERLDASLADLRGQKELIETSATRNVISFSPTATPMILTVAPPARESVGTVSAQRLRHRPPKAARKAYEKAAKLLLQNRKAAEAATELEKAIALDPNYAEAHNELGVAYVRLGRNPEAASEFRRAIALVPGESLPLSNLAWVLSAMRPPAETESH